MARVMNDREGSWRGRSGDGSADQVSRRDGRRAALAVGHYTLVAQITGAGGTGAPWVPAEVSSDSHARASDTGAAPASLLDLFGPPASVAADPSDTERAPTPSGHPAVQRTAIRDATDALGDPAANAEVAGRGVEGAGMPLPHLGPIQASFGHHDVSSVQAHQGAAATRAARDLGATAYAFGNSVAFDGSPDLHTAAHEAAHVVQQRGGVQLKRGKGQPGDVYERHADAVADAVVAGRPAEHLLDQVAGAPSAVVQTASVQRTGDGAEKAGATNPIYVNENRLELIGAIMDRVEETALTQPHPRLRWTNEKRAREALGLAISVYIRSAPADVTLKRMMMLSYPSTCSRSSIRHDTVQPEAGSRQ